MNASEASITELSLYSVYLLEADSQMITYQTVNPIVPFRNLEVKFKSLTATHSDTQAKKLKFRNLWISFV